ncbi:phytoene/squalene synthase family protein [Tenacibaculum sp. E3R01]|uniref:phytoene/squalene synthase family protein n=1 Tax=Tenacibaculum sp. E3R01 TaxID=2267227 RepID=UPI000DE8F082|nr:phytoene/squalene synthase family protein [Tenacibaculum sp. E3R01]RBW56428.1 phytoene/squalene synthase family protein [Tenacibaculum sp. E3R01]
MKQLFDQVSYNCSKLVTKKYSTSFSLATRMLAPEIRAAVYNIYGFVRFADEIVDTFHEYDKEALMYQFEKNYYLGKHQGISLNPILNSFIQTVNKYHIEDELIQAFLKSMKADLFKTEYTTQEEYNEYIYGSADVVGLMCLRVFVKGDNKKYEELKKAAMRLGSAFQKVNFLRDLKDDIELLNRSYFPNIDLKQLDKDSKEQIIKEIEDDFEYAYKNGVLKLPVEAKFGVYIAYRYYRKLLKKLKSVPSSQIMDTRIRISNSLKISLLMRGYARYKLNLL